jgi:hypothetical protein
MESLIKFMEKWQTLIGSFIGGIVGLLAALVVAYSQRRRKLGTGSSNIQLNLLLNSFIIILILQFILSQECLAVS